MRNFLIILLFIAIPFSFGQRFDSQKISASKVEKNVKSVNRVINWHNSLDVVKQKAEKTGKMIFWMQLVGELDGGL